MIGFTAKYKKEIAELKDKVKHLEKKIYDNTIFHENRVKTLANEKLLAQGKCAQMEDINTTLSNANSVLSKKVEIFERIEEINKGKKGVLIAPVVKKKKAVLPPTKKRATKGAKK